MLFPVNDHERWCELGMDDRRRGLIKAAALVPLAWAVTGRAAATPLAIGTTPVFLDQHADLLRRWQHYLEARMQRPVAFVQRGSYRETMDLLLTGRLDAAWICGYPYVRYRSQLRLLAVPVFQGEPLYRSYVIVPATDTRSLSLLDLKGRVYAYSDPLSNSGWLVPQATLLRRGEKPGTFFRKSFFTHSHRAVVQACASGLADGGSVDGYVWETLARFHPELTRATRVVEHSEPFGFPPIAARASLRETEALALRRALLGMSKDDDGRWLLARLNLDGFVQGSDSLFEGIARSVTLVEDA
jgi:phosphonate transport system substrate-binding protein